MITTLLLQPEAIEEVGSLKGKQSRQHMAENRTEIILTRGQFQVRNLETNRSKTDSCKQSIHSWGFNRFFWASKASFLFGGIISLSFLAKKLPDSGLFFFGRY